MHRYIKAVGKEVTNINRILHYQSIGMDVLNSFIMASFVGLFNFITTHYMDANSLDGVLEALGMVAVMNGR